MTIKSDAFACEDDELERYRATSNKAQYIKALPAKTLVSLYMKAQEEYQSESSSIQAEMEEQIRVSRRPSCLPQEVLQERFLIAAFSRSNDVLQDLRGVFKLSALSMQGRSSMPSYGKHNCKFGMSSSWAIICSRKGPGIE
jgi:hypothetical protein